MRIQTYECLMFTFAAAFAAVCSRAAAPVSFRMFPYGGICPVFFSPSHPFTPLFGCLPLFLLLLSQCPSPAAWTHQCVGSTGSFAVYTFAAQCDIKRCGVECTPSRVNPFAIVPPEGTGQFRKVNVILRATLVGQLLELVPVPQSTYGAACNEAK